VLGLHQDDTFMAFSLEAHLESAQKLVRRTTHHAVCPTVSTRGKCSSSTAQSGHLLWPGTTHATQDAATCGSEMSNQLRSVGNQLTTLLVLPEKYSAGLWEE